MEVLATLDSREIAERLASRYANSDNAHRAGHMFEVMHALSFNRDAISHDETVRAVVTEWAPGGSQTAASDIDIHDHGSLLEQAQAKLYDSISGTAHEIARPGYDGMQRLIAEDKLAAVTALLDRKLTLQPDGLNAGHFQDARADLTSQLHHGDVHSTGVSYPEAQTAAADPTGWADHEVHGAVGADVTAGAEASAAAGAAIAAVVSAAVAAAKVRSGEVSPMEAVITASGAAAKAAVRGGSVGGLGAGIEAASLSGHLAEQLGGGTLPFALARGGVAIAEASYAFAKGEIDEAEFAVRSGEASARISITWAFSCIGQTIIPIPVVGAIVGSLVGQLVGVQCIKGLQTGLTAARADAADEHRLRLLERQLLAATLLVEELALVTGELGAERNAYFSAQVMPSFDRARRALFGEDDDEVLVRFSALVGAFGDKPLFTTMTEFNDWMLTGAEPLILDGNWRP